jgi:periplasmic protein TonB
MKRCPHCGVQDHDEAILCKSCMRSFAAPPTSNARGQTAPRQRSLIGTALIRLVVLWTLLYAAIHFDVPSKLVAWFSEWQRGQQQEAVEQAQTAAATVAEAPATPPPSSPPSEPSAPPKAASPEAAPAAVETLVRREPARPPAAPPPAPPSAPSAAPVRKAESRPSERPAVAQPSPAPAPAASAAQPLRVGGNIKAPAKVRDVRPVYPAAAHASRIQGIVIIEAIIGADGRVRETRVLRSVPLLDEAALDAVRQWEYEPTLLNGSPVPVIMTVTVNFRLQ